MSRRLTLLAAASIAICIALWLAVRFFFADVMPASWGEDPQPFWRLENGSPADDVGVDHRYHRHNLGDCGNCAPSSPWVRGVMRMG